VTYQYDELNRLIQAQTTSSAWGQNFSYDGFGNLTAKTVTPGHGVPPNVSLTISAATNRVQG
jgi:YD repeat-containing protein